MTPLVLSGLGHAYGDTPVLAGVDLELADGEFVAVLGASGCGKTTLLRSVAGLVTPTRGRISVAGTEVVRDGRELLPVERRGVGLVFQEYALFPNLSVFENVGFGLPRAERGERVPALLALAGLEGLAERRPSELSGGQQQRVALIRSLAPKPHLMLLDEPFSNVDAERRMELGSTLKALIRAEGTAALLVTHDRTDALRLADRVMVLVPQEGGARVAQLDTPEVVYARPASEAVARLTGSCVVVAGSASGARAETALGTVELLEPREGPVRLVVREEQLVFEPGGELPVQHREFVGRAWRLALETAAGPVVVEHATPHDRGAVRLRGAVWALP